MADGRIGRLRNLFMVCGSLAVGLILSHTPAAAQIKAFPQAEGFGAEATGGRGGLVYHVTRLDDANVDGTLRYGLTTFAPSTPVTIVFDVGGWIELTSKLGVTRNNVTIAGHTAPGGIGVRGAQVSIGGDDIIVRHMRFRPGKATNTDHDSINTNENAQRVIYDHISAEFSTDGGFDLQANEVTLQYSSVSFGLISHSTGALIQSPTGGAAGSLSFHHNLWGHNQTRNPKARAAIIDWRDNVIYNYHDGFIAGDSETDVNPNWKANFDGNTYISNTGGNAGSGGRPMMTGGRTQNYDLYYGVNALDRDSDAQDDPIAYTREQAMASQTIVSSAYNWSTTPFNAPSIWQNANPAEAYQRVLAEFGATPWDRDEVNALLHDQVLSRSGSRISHENQLVALGVSNNGFGTLGGETAPLDTDRDGMPDEWELKYGLLPNRASQNGDFDADGFLDLEEYLNDLGAFKAIGPIEYVGSPGGRYAAWSNWVRRWEPSRLDDVHIDVAGVTVDAVGQRAGTLKIGTGAGSSGSLNVVSGWLEVTDDLIIGADPGATAAVNLTGGRLSTQEIHLGAGGQLNFTGGTLHVDVVNSNLANQGGTLAPGQSIGQTHVVGDLTLQSGTLQIELAADLLSADALVVDGLATLGGALNVVPLGPTPADGLSWKILTAANGIEQNFSSVTPGYYLQEQGNELWLFAGAEPILTGDYNDDGVVDAGDYVRWRNALAGFGTLENETASPNSVDELDYAAWKGNYGAPHNGSGGLAGQSGAIPEPSSALLALCAALAMLMSPRRVTRTRALGAMATAWSGHVGRPRHKPRRSMGAMATAGSGHVGVEV